MHSSGKTDLSQDRNRSDWKLFQIILNIQKREMAEEANVFAEQIVSEFKGAAHIYLLSAGSGKANSAQQLQEYIKDHHHELSEKVLATGSADVNALSDSQLLALGRDRKLLFMRTYLQLT